VQGVKWTCCLLTFFFITFIIPIREGFICRVTVSELLELLSIGKGVVILISEFWRGKFHSKF